MDIKYIKDNEGNNFFPVVHEKGVVDDNGTTLESKLQSKQDAISDLSTIRSGASAGATAVQSVTVGTTTTGAAGSSASVTNTGTATAPVLSFTIPQGEQGVKGDTVIMGGESSYTLYNTTGDAVDGAMTQQAVTRELTELSGKLKIEDTTLDFAIADENGYDIAQFSAGHIKTKNFDSSVDATTSSRGLMSAADKTKLETVEEGAEVNDVETATNDKYDLTIEDEEGYVIVKMQGGYIKTKNFDSEQQTIKLATIEEGAEVNDTLVDSSIAGDLNIEDEERNILACFREGHIKTKNFDSKDIDVRVTALEGRVDYNTPSNYLGRDISIFAKIMCIGDSLTEGAFNYLSDGRFNNNTKASLLGRPYSYPQYLAKLTGCEVTNLGKSGHSSTMWYDYYTTGGGASTDFSGYDCAIIQLGTNDDNDTLDTVTKTALDNIINKVKTANAGIKIFFAGIINAKSYPAATEGESYYVKDQFLRNYYNTYYANDDQVFFIDHVAYGHLRDLPNSQHGGSYPVDNYNEGHLSAYGYWRLAQDYVSIISYIMHSDKIGKFRKIQFIGTSYECY